MLLFSQLILIASGFSQSNTQEQGQKQPLLTQLEKDKLSSKEIAIAYQKANVSDSALVYVNKAIQTTAEDSPREIANLQALKADILYAGGKYKEGLIAIDKSIVIFETNKLTNTNVYAKYLFRKGSIYLVLNDTRAALKNLVEAQKLAKNDNNIAEILSTLSDLYFTLGDEEGALEAATKLTEKPLVDNISKVYIGKSYSIAAKVYRKNKDFEEAIKQEEKAIALYRENKSVLGTAYTLVNLSDDLNKSGKYEKALEKLDEATQENLVLNNQYIGGAILLNKAESLAKLKRYNEAYDLFDQSLERFENLSIPAGAAEAILAKSKALLDNNKLDAAENNAKASLKLAKENDLIGLEEQSYLILYKVYKQKQGTTQALLYHEKYAEVKDAISTNEKQQSIDNLKIRFDVQRLENEISLKNKELVLSEEKEKSSMYFKLLLGLGIVSLLLFSYRQYKLTQVKKVSFEAEKELAQIKRAQLKSEIDLKKQEVTDFALQISDQNTTLTKLSKKIGIVLKTTDPKTKMKLRNIITEITDVIDINQEKVALYSKIDEVKSDFYHTIKEQYPALSTREVEIAAYLRLNLSSKQIAKQFNITQQSVNNYRFKIRKKIGLETTDNLTAFLKNL